MTTLPPVVALEIGTSKVIALVGELREDGHVMITGMGEHPSAGVRKGEIIDLENAAICVRSVLHAAEESSGVMVRQIHLALSGGHIQSMVNRGTVPVLDSQEGITAEDVKQVMNVSRAINLAQDREMLHTICRHFCIDEQERVTKPEGMEGAKLSLDMLMVHGVRTTLRNTIKVVRSVPVDVQDVAFSGLCSALAALTPEQKKSGVIVLDLGGGTTDFLAYAENVVAIAGSLGVGGDHVTNDIALAFNIPTAQAERLKCESGSATIDASVFSQRIALPAEVGFRGRAVSLKALHTVVNARMDEILNMVKARLEQSSILHHAGAGIVLTGGAACMGGIAGLVEKVFGLPCTIGKLRNVSGLATATEGPQHATAIGMVHYAFKTAEQVRRPSLRLGNWMGRIFKRR